MTGPGLVTAPWNPEQVASLNGYQHAANVHPFTCPEPFHATPGTVHPVALHGKVTLVATESGWVCPGRTPVGGACAYTQNWAHAGMADGSWEAAAADAMDAILPRDRPVDPSRARAEGARPRPRPLPASSPLGAGEPPEYPLMPGPIALAAVRHSTTEELAASMYELVRRLAGYENLIGWNTDCANCASVMDSAARETFRAEHAERLAVAQAGLASSLARQAEWWAAEYPGVTPPPDLLAATRDAQVRVRDADADVPPGGPEDGGPPA